MLLSFCVLCAQNSVKFIDVRNDKIPILIDGEWEIMDHYKVLNLLEDNTILSLDCIISTRRP